MRQYVAVMDYRTGSIKLYTIDGITDDVEKWLRDHTDYSEDECYYMCSTTPINVYTVHTVKLVGSMPIEESEDVPIEIPSTRVMRTQGVL